MNTPIQIFVLTSCFGLSVPFLIRRDIRYTNVSAHFGNKSVGELIELNIRQYHGQHYLTMHSNTFISSSPDLAIIEVIKCKEYYLYCVNYKSWILHNYCNVTETIAKFLIFQNTDMNKMKCPIVGEIYIHNMTVNTEMLMSTLSNSIVDRWWENYWIFKSKLVNKDGSLYISSEMKFYIISQVLKPPRIKIH